MIVVIYVYFFNFHTAFGSRPVPPPFGLLTLYTKNFGLCTTLKGLFWTFLIVLFGPFLDASDFRNTSFLKRFRTGRFPCFLIFQSKNKVIFRKRRRFRRKMGVFCHSATSLERSNLFRLSEVFCANNSSFERSLALSAKKSRAPFYRHAGGIEFTSIRECLKTRSGR